MENVWLAPVHPLAVVVTVIIAVIAFVPGFVTENTFISPLPLAANPIRVLSFDQLKDVPDTEPLKEIMDVVSLLQKTRSGTVLRVGVGFTVADTAIRATVVHIPWVAST